jgi:hypothetical protein
MSGYVESVEANNMKNFRVPPRTILFSLVPCLMAFTQAQSMFMPLETKTVPIDRVLKNFERRYATNHNDVEAVYHLARIHSMAYATHSQIVNMDTNRNEPFYYYGGDSGIPEELVPARNLQVNAEAMSHLTNAILFYQQARQLVDQGKLEETNRWLELPIDVGLAWCLEANGQHTNAIIAYRQALQRAWDIEIEPLPTVKERLNWSWDQIRAFKNPLSRPPGRGHIGPGICYSEEIIHNLLPLLDSRHDAGEIAQLQLDQKKINAMGRAITPILMSLQPNLPFEQLVNPNFAVPFDLDGSGLRRPWGWITPRAAWLVFDPQQKGQITSGLQMFGSVTFWIFWRNGYDALSALDDNGDGRLTGDELRGLALWQDRNGDGICDPGEVRPVADWGITAIECGGHTNQTGVLCNPRGVRLRDGTTRATYDWIAPSPVKF